MKTAAKVILVIWFSLAAGVSIAQHGKPKTGNYNFIYSFIGMAIEIMLLTIGGFWSA